MHLGDSDRGKLDKAIDRALSFAPTFVGLSRSPVGKEIMKVSNERDFVLGAVLAYVMTDFVVISASKAGLTEDESAEILGLTLKRFFREIDLLTPRDNKVKKQSKRTKQAKRG